MASPFGERRDAVVAAGRDERRGSVIRAEAIGHVVVAPGLELAGLTALPGRRSSRAVALRREHLDEPLVGGWSASHSGVKRVSSSCSARCSRSDGGEVGELVQRVRRARGATGRRAQQRKALDRSGHVTASSCATIPPKLMPTTRQVSQPTASSDGHGVGCVLGHRVGRSGIAVRPRPRWSCATTSKRCRNGSMMSAAVASVAPDPLQKRSGGPEPARS